MGAKVVTVIGARPQFVKAAAVSRAIAAHNASPGRAPITEVIVHTGQHYDPAMSEVFFTELGIPAPAHHLEVGSGPHGEQTGEMMKALERVVLAEEPDAVMVYGDTNSTTAGALVAAKLQIPVLHVEAGLRSFNREMPEEINRVVTDHLSSLLFAPTDTAVQHLADEGITDGVHHVGDVMLDVFLETLASLASDAATEHPRDFALVTLHRPSNTDDPQRLREVIDAVSAVSTRHPVLWPVHPRLRSQLAAIDLPASVTVTEPVGYRAMVALLREATVVITDSGGLQKEAYWAATPCVTLRSETEWVETVEDGWNELAVEDLAGLPDQVGQIIERLSDAPTPVGRFGAGDASARIVEIIEESLHR